MSELDALARRHAGVARDAYADARPPRLSPDPSRLPGPRGPRRATWIALAVAAALLIAVALTTLGGAPPPLEPAANPSLGGGPTTSPSAASSPGSPTADIEQPQFGEGWRLLGEGRDVGEAGRTAVATTDDQLERLWREAGLSGGVPEVDWDSEIAVWFGAIWSTGREIRLTDLVVEDDTVYPLTPALEPDQTWADDARPHSFVVAVARSVLPDQVPLNVQLNAEPLGYGWPHERTVVEVNLAVPGSTATDEQLHDDPGLTPEIPTTVEDGGSIPLGQKVLYWFTPGECGWERLGTFDGQEWRLAEDSSPPDNLPPVEGDAWLTRLDEERILYSIPETELIYVPAENGWTCEDG